MAEFPDIELAFLELLNDIAPTSTVTAKVLVTPGIVCQKTPSPGTDRLGLFDTTIIEVQCMGTERPDSIDINKKVRNRLAGARAIRTSEGLLDTIKESSSPTQIPYEDEDIRRVTSVWIVTARKQ